MCAKKLKTLKDLHRDEYGLVLVSLLKAEAVKWVKERVGWKYIGDAEYEDETGKKWDLESWIKHFFNLTEEDLK